DVLRELPEVLRASHVHVPFFAKGSERRAYAPEPAETALGLAPRRLRVHAGLDELASPQLEMEGELVVDFLLDAGPPPDAVEAVAGHCLDNQGIALDGRPARLVATNCNSRFF